MSKKSFFIVCGMFLVRGICFSQTPTNDPHWNYATGPTGPTGIPAVPRWYDDFTTGTTGTTGGVQYVNGNWEVIHNFDQGGQAQVWVKDQATIVGPTGPTGAVGLRLRTEKLDYSSTAYIRGGAFLSTNSGSSWSATGLTNNYYVNAFAISGSNLFAGTDADGVFLSTNSGTSWTAVNTNLTNLHIITLVISGSNLFAGTNGGGVFLSTNNGTNWSEVNTSLTNHYINSLTVSGSNLFAGTSGGGVFLSTNSGTSWSAVNTGLSNLFVNSLLVSGSNLFAGTNEGVFLSTNSGTSWSVVNTGLSNLFVNSLLVNGSNLFAGTNGGGVFLSTNSGTSWSAINGSTPTNLTSLNVQALAISGSNLFAGTNGGGVFLSTNSGTSWSAINGSTPTDLTSLNVHSLFISGSNLFAGATSGAAYPNHHYVSGCVTSHGATDLSTGRLVKYGYIEAKITMSNTFGLWSAFWLWACYPDCATDNDEIDIIETIPGKTVGESCLPYYNQQGDKNIYSSGIPITQAIIPACDPANSIRLISVNDYTVPHRYGIEWSPSKIIWYIDDQVVRNSPNPGYPGDPNGNISQALTVIFGS